jgi:hypothetical protein
MPDLPEQLSLVIRLFAILTLVAVGALMACVVLGLIWCCAQIVGAL